MTGDLLQNGDSPMDRLLVQHTDACGRATDEDGTPDGTAMGTLQ
jgi:hypothetical protein